MQSHQLNAVIRQNTAIVFQVLPNLSAFSSSSSGFSNSSARSREIDRAHQDNHEQPEYMPLRLADSKRKPDQVSRDVIKAVGFGSNANTGAFSSFAIHAFSVSYQGW